MIGKHFHIYGVQITQKFILQARKSKVDFYSCPPRKTLPGSSHHFQVRGKLHIPHPKAEFWPKSVFPSVGKGRKRKL